MKYHKYKLPHILYLIIFTMFLGCSSVKTNQEMTRFHDDGRSKPLVAFPYVFDQSQANIGWDLSEELTTTIRNTFNRKNRLCLVSSEKIDESIINLNETHDPFENNIDWIPQTFQSEEFVVFTELTEHHIHDKPLKGSFIDKFTPSSELSLTVRLRIFDLRRETPKVILQEFIHQTHLIPKSSKEITACPDKWKKIIFPISPIGLAHSSLIKEIVRRSEEYILLASTQ